MRLWRAAAAQPGGGKTANGQNPLVAWGSIIAGGGFRGSVEHQEGGWEGEKSWSIGQQRAAEQLSKFKSSHCVRGIVCVRCGCKDSWVQCTSVCVCVCAHAQGASVLTWSDRWDTETLPWRIGARAGRGRRGGIWARTFSEHCWEFLGGGPAALTRRTLPACACMHGSDGCGGPAEEGACSRQHQGQGVRHVRVGSRVVAGRMCVCA